MVPNEIFCIIVSKYSPSCTKIFESVKFIAPHLNTRVIDIDNANIRKIILQSNKIKTVPCIAIIYPDDNKVDFFEENNAINILNHAVQKVQQKIQQQHAQTQQQQIVQQQAQLAQQQQKREQVLDSNDMSASVNDRLKNVLPISQKIPEGHTNLAKSSIASAPNLASEPIEGGTFIDDGDYENDNPSTGMSKEDILGTQHSSMNREKDRKSNITRSKMEDMIKERDELDTSYTQNRQKMA